MMLTVENIHKHYEGQPLLNGVSFQVAAGETVCLLGASGSGKSTLLRIIAGLEEAETGRILWDGQDLLRIPVHSRRFGLMFQDYALFPHRNVTENVAFGLRMQGLSPAEITARVNEALARVNLREFADRRVTDLSGGEQQRVALARALAPRPRLLMLDEPLGALDRALREQLGDFLRVLLHETGIPAIYVTHDQEEAFAIADRILLLHQGQVEQDGTPSEVYRQPKSAWAARFLGLSNLIPGTLLQKNPMQVKTALGVFEPSCDHPNDMQPGQQVTLLLRPTGVQVASRSDGLNLLSGKVLDVVFRGEDYRVTLVIGDDVQVSFQVENPPAVGDVVQYEVDAGSIRCLK
jgi:spermidine/putrescine transport system ATP-binding protein